MKQGNFDSLAKYYINRPAYDKEFLSEILEKIGFEHNKNKKKFIVADIGAGTGKLTKILSELCLKVIAVEPSKKMLYEGMKYTKGLKIKWKEGSGEHSGLKNNSVNWVIMASSFHWTDPELSLPEFNRILKDGGYFTAIWNPRNVEKSKLETKIEKIIYKIAPDIKRVSSGSKKYTKDWNKIIISTGHFKNVMFMEADYLEVMSKERYLGIWRSVNDIRTQLGEEKFSELLKLIKKEISNMEEIVVPYKMRAWTAQKV